MSWQEDVLHIHRAVVKNYPVGSDEDRRFLTLALAGEVGELCNLIKKQWRGDMSTHSRPFLDGLNEELADVRIYLELLAQMYGVDLDLACEAKLPVLHKRWPEARSDTP